MDGSEKIPRPIKTAFDEITEYFIKNKYVNVCALSTDNDSNDYESNYQQISYIKVMTFYLLAEYKQSKKLAGLIHSAIDAYIESTDSTISTSKLNKNVDINLDSIYADFNKVFSAFSTSLHTSIKTKLDINIDNKKEYVIFFLNMLYQYIGDDNRELFLTYIPSIIYTFYANYKKEISSCIKKLIKKKASQNEILEIKNFLTTIRKCIPKYQIRDYEKKIQNSVISFLFTSLYNAIITNYKKNFVVDFLWFERNIGFYQYYLTAVEYSKVINYISYFEPTDSISKMDISIPTALYLYFKDNILDDHPKDTNNDTSNDTPNDNKPLWKILDRIINNKFPDDDIINILNEIFLKKNITENLYLDYNNIIAYFKLYLESDISPFKNRFMIHTVQFIYYNELLNKKGFVKQDKYGCSFHCDEITDNIFKLKDVDFNLWLTSDDLADMDLNIINIDNKYYTVSPILTSNSPCSVILSLDDSIIFVTKAKGIWLNGNLIKKRQKRF